MIAWLVSSAFAGQLYINGTFVDPASIPGVTMQNVSISFDAQGNIQVSAPGYKIEVEGNPTPPPPMAQPKPPTGQPVTAPAQTPTPPATNAGQPAVAAARWWLVTEDNSSVGHTINVLVNGQLVRTVGSSQPQQILDVGKWLKPGSNTIDISSNSVGASGGTFYIYIGTGSDQSGTVVMENPLVQFGVSNTRSGPYSRSFKIDVDR